MGQLWGVAQCRWLCAKGHTTTDPQDMLEGTPHNAPKAETLGQVHKLASRCAARTCTGLLLQAGATLCYYPI